MASAASRIVAPLLAVACGGALAQVPVDYQPQIGQPGKDVVWVPSPGVLVERMLDMAGVTAADYVIDLGSGDGRTVIAAAKRGARALGIEYNPELVALATRAAEKEGVGARAKFVKADIFEADFSEATVVTLFLGPNINLKLRPRLLALKPGTRVVSNSFTLGDWEPDLTTDAAHVPDCQGWCDALMWIVPANVAGTWSTPHGQVLLNQKYQKLSGVLRARGRALPVEGEVRGEEISFKAGGREYRGRVVGKSLELR